jgi:hypothetical protein
MKNIFFCFIVLLITYGCKKDNNNNSDSNHSGSGIFPNKIGDTWVYLVNDTSFTSSNSGIVSQYNMTISIIDSIQLSGGIKANRWVYNYPGGTDTNYVFQHGDTISFAANTLPNLYIIRQYIIPFRLHYSWQYVMNSLHNVTIDSLSAIIVGMNSFENAYDIIGISGMPDNFFYIDEWVADYVGVVKRYFDNQGYTRGPDRHKTSWLLISYQLE